MEWEEVVSPSTVNVVVGKKGSGKSALAYYLAESLGSKYGLLPVIADFPPKKQCLLPPSFVIKSIDEALLTEDAFLLVDEGTTLLPAGGGLDELVKSLMALSRQRNQIVILVFHSSRDVGSKILRGADIIIAKKPSLRQIEHGSKSAWWTKFLLRARQELAKYPDYKEYAYVDSEEPEFRGILRNPVPSFWSEGLSKAYAGVNMSLERINSEVMPMEERIQKMKEESGSITSGKCQICGKEYGILYAGVCEICFREWAITVIRAPQEREREQREFLGERLEARRRHKS